MKIPAPLSANYRIATSREIRSWSFGALTATRDAGATFQDHVAGTLHDQGIFGPIQDFKCACGQYAGDRYKGMICDQCGVKIAPTTIRGSRFGHIEFPNSIGHPYGPHIELQCFPVLPILFVESPGGYPLLMLYDQLIEACREETPAKIEAIITLILDHLTPVVITVNNWRMAASRILACGLALRHVAEDSPKYCGQCGYLVAGLQAALCPGCGSPFK